MHEQQADERIARAAALSTAREESRDRLAPATTHTEIADPRKLHYLNRMLRGVRQVNRLIVSDLDPLTLLEGVCDCVIEILGYPLAWGYLTTEKHGITAVSGAGCDALFLRRHFQEDGPPPGWRQMVDHDEVQVLSRDVLIAEGVPVTDLHAPCLMGRRLAFHGELYGVLAVACAEPFDEELSLFTEMAGDLAFALYRRQLEREHFHAEQDLRGFLDSVDDMIYYRGLDGRILPRNAACAMITGYDLVELHNQPHFWREMIHPDDHKQLESFLNASDNMVVRCELEYRLRHRNGEWRWIQSRMVADHDESGAIIGYNCIDRDISAQKRTEAALRASEEVHRQLFNAASDAVYMHSVEDDGSPGPFVQINDRAGEMLGYSRYQLMQMTLSDVDVGRSPEALAAHFRELRQSGPVVYETRHRTASGRDLPVEISSRLFRLQGKPQVLSIARDMSARKAEEAERARLSAAVEQAAEIIFITDAGGLIQYVNPAFERETGYSRDDALGRKPSILASGQTPPENYARMWQVLSSGNVYCGSFTNRRKNGALMEVDATISPVRDADGGIVAYVAVTRDVTKERQLERHLRHAQKMEAIGTLAGGIAHDFNNILTVISGSLQLAQRQVSTRQDVDRYIEQARLASDRARDLVAQILLVSRRSEEAATPIELIPIVKETIRFIRASLPSTIEIRHDLRARQATVLADHTQLHQILMNLCTNAHHAMRDKGGILTISLSTESCAEQDNSGDFVRLAVSDTGYGIEESIRERIFEPYFTTKPRGEGSGMGLAVVHGIVSRCGGAIEVQSQVGHGTTFIVRLPLHQAAEQITVDSNRSLLRGHERVLLVDDEAAITSMAAELLASLGYDVTSRTDSTDALQLVLQHPDQFDIVLTDLTMPHMTGLELAERIRQELPRLPVILWTGYNELIGEQEALRRGFDSFLHKPFTLAQLTQTLRQVLDS